MLKLFRSRAKSLAIQAYHYAKPLTCEGLEFGESGVVGRGRRRSQGAVAVRDDLVPQLGPVDVERRRAVGGSVEDGRGPRERGRLRETGRRRKTRRRIVTRHVTCTR